MPSPTIKIWSDLLLRARTCRMEPHILLFSIAKHLAGDQKCILRDDLKDFVLSNKIWSRSRFNTLLKEGEDVLWISYIEKATNRPMLFLIAKRKVAYDIVSRTGNKPIGTHWAEIPITELRGVAWRRAIIFEARTGSTLEKQQKRARPRSREVLQYQTHVPRSTQQRYNRRVGTIIIPARLLLEVSNKPIITPFDFDTRFFVQKMVNRETGEITYQCFQRLPNLYISRFASFRRKPGKDQHFLANGENGAVPPRRYVNDANILVKYNQRGLEPLMQKTVFPDLESEAQKELRCIIYEAPREVAA